VSLSQWVDHLAALKELDDKLAALERENEGLRADVETLRSGIRTWPHHCQASSRMRAERLLAHTEHAAPPQEQAQQ